MGRWTFAVGLVALIAQTASAQDLESGKARYAEARFEEAQRAFEASLSDPQLSPKAAAEANLYLALLEVVLGRPENAESFIQTALLLDPAVAVPPGSSPDFASLVARMAERHPRGSELVLSPRSDSATLTLVPPIPTLIVSLSLRCTLVDGRTLSQQGASSAVRLTLPADGKLSSCAGHASTAQGASLFRIERDLAPRYVPSKAGEDSSGFPTAVVVVGSVVAVAAVAAVAIGFALAGDDTASVGGVAVERW